MGSRRPGDTNGPELLSPEDFQAELALLGLSGREFGTREYAEILGETLEMEITICVLPDDHYPELTRKMARAGKLAELTYSTNPLGAVILVPPSLPPIVRTLSVYHELGHVAAGDILSKSGKEARKLVDWSTFLEDLPEGPRLRIAGSASKRRT